MDPTDEFLRSDGGASADESAAADAAAPQSTLLTPVRRSPRRSPSRSPLRSDQSPGGGARAAASSSTDASTEMPHTTTSSSDATAQAMPAVSHSPAQAVPAVSHSETSTTAPEVSREIKALAARLCVGSGEPHRSAVAAALASSPELVAAVSAMMDARTSATAMDVDADVPVDADDASLLAQVRQLKADKLMLEVEFEQQCHTLEHTNSELVTERDEWHGKAEKLKKELASAETSCDTMRAEYRTIKAQLEAYQTELTTKRTTLSSLEKDHHASLEVLLKKEEDHARVREECSVLEARLQSAKNELAQAEASMFELQSSERTAKFTTNKLEQELTLAAKQNDWLTAELDAKSKELYATRTEKSSQIQSLQAELDAAKSSAQSADASVGSLKQTISALTASNEQLQSKLADTESRALLTEESLRSELTTQKKLNEVLKRADIEKSAKIEDMRKTLADVQREVDARAAEMEQRLEEKESALAELEAKCRELAMNKSELQERLEAVDKFVGQSPSPSSGSRKSPSAKLSATAAAVERIQQSGQTFTEVYANYVKMEAEAAQLRAENSQLRTAMQDILNEVQTRSAHYDQIEQSYATLIGETNTLSGKLETAMHERETATRQLGTVQRDKKQLSDDNKWFRQTNKDLSRQLQRLLLEVEELQGRVAPGSQPFEMELEQGVQGVISERLLIFQNIEQLQEKNAELLDVVRQLSDRNETDELEQRKEELQTLTHTNEEMASQLRILAEQRSKNEMAMQSVLNELDMYKRLAAEHERHGQHRGGDRSATSSPGKAVTASTITQPAPTTSAVIDEYQRRIDELQKAFDAYRQETSKDAATLKTEFQQAQKQISDFRVQHMQAKTQNEFLLDRISVLNGTVDQQNKELAELRHRHSTLQANIAQYELRLRDAADAKSKVEGDMERVKYEAAHLRAEKDLLKDGEKRATEEREMLIQERNRLNELIRNLQTMHNELERTTGEAKRQLRMEKEAVDKELADLRARITNDAAEVKALTLRKDAELKEVQVKLTRAIEDHQRSREVTVAAEAKNQSLNDRIQLLTEELAKKEVEIRELRTRGSTIAAATLRRLSQIGSGGLATSVTAEDINISVEAEQAEQEIRARERKLELELQAVKKSLAEAEQAVERQRKHAELYQEISKAAEEKLASLNATYETYRTSTDGRVADLELENQSLREQADTSTAALAEAEKKLQELQLQADAAVTQLRQELATLQGRVDDIIRSEAEARANQHSLQEDLHRQRSIAEEASASYESELVKHARDIEQLSAIKESFQQLQSEKNSLAKKLEAANKNLATVESHFNVQKETMEKQARDLNSRLEDLLSQNNILHSQIDTLSTQISRFQSASPSLDMVLGGPGADTTATGEDINRRTIDELREVTRYLRREREVLDFEKEAQLQENKRLQLQLEHANRTIEETRSLLTDERQRLENGVVISRGEYSEMTSKVNQLDLIRESNTTLREENLRNQKLNMEARAKVEQLTAELEPLHEQLRNISAELEARNQEIKALEEDNARWKSRTHEILAKYDKVDPAEHRQLQENYTLLQQQSAVQVDELTKAVDAKDVALKASEERASKIQRYLEQWKEKSTRLEQALKSLTEKLQASAGVETTIEENKLLKAQLESLQMDKTRLTERLRDIAKNAQQFKANYEEAQKALAEHQTKMTELATKGESEVQAARTELDMRYRVQLSLSDNKVKRLEAQKTQLDAQVATLTADVEKLRKAASEVVAKTMPVETAATATSPVWPTTSPMLSGGVKRKPPQSPAPKATSVPHKEDNVTLTAPRSTSPITKRIRVSVTETMASVEGVASSIEEPAPASVVDELAPSSEPVITPVSADTPVEVPETLPTSVEEPAEVAEDAAQVDDMMDEDVVVVEQEGEAQAMDESEQRAEGSIHAAEAEATVEATTADVDMEAGEKTPVVVEELAEELQQYEDAPVEYEEDAAMEPDMAELPTEPEYEDVAEDEDEEVDGDDEDADADFASVEDTEDGEYVPSEDGEADEEDEEAEEVDVGEDVQEAVAEETQAEATQLLEDILGGDIADTQPKEVPAAQPQEVPAAKPQEVPAAQPQAPMIASPVSQSAATMASPKPARGESATEDVIVTGKGGVIPKITFDLPPSTTTAAVPASAIAATPTAAAAKPVKKIEKIAWPPATATLKPTMKAAVATTPAVTPKPAGKLKTTAPATTSKIPSSSVARKPSAGPRPSATGSDLLALALGRGRGGLPRAATPDTPAEGAARGAAAALRGAGITRGGKSRGGKRGGGAK